MQGSAPRSIRRPRAWLVAIPLLAYLLLVVVKLGVYHFDVSRFVVAGDRFFSPTQLTYPIAVQTHSTGYDGQFFYRLALDPLSTRRVAYGITMEDHPVVRAQRILYPAAAWVLSLGRGGAVPYALVAINLIGVAVIGCIASLLAASFGVRRRWGLLIPFYPGFVIAICWDTAEIAATTLALSAILAATRARWPLAAVLAAAAVLTRETTLLYLTGFGLVALVEGARRRAVDRRVLYCLVPLAVFLAWQAILKAIWGSLPFDDLGHHDLSTVPLVAYAQAVSGFGLALVRHPFGYHALFSFVTCLSVAVFVGFVAAETVRARRAVLPHLVPWALYAALAALFTDAIWSEPLGYLRILCDLYALGVCVLIAAGNERALRRLAPVVAATWLATVAFVL